MAIITFSPIIESMSGHFGDEVHYKWRGINCSRAYKKPDNPDTALQRSNRSMFSAAVHSWQKLAPEDKEIFGKRAVNLNMSGYNLYISEYMKAGIFREEYDNACKPAATIAGLHCGHSRFSAASASLLLRFSFYPASILPLSGRIPGPQSVLSAQNSTAVPP